MPAKSAVLKSGQKANRKLVGAILNRLHNLLEGYPIAFVELVRMCREPKYRPEQTVLGFLYEGMYIVDYALPAPRVYPLIQTVVLNAVEGEDLLMTVGSPYAK